MTFQLAPEALAQGYRVECHETVGSTNALALERALEGDAGPLWICTLRQESGRGRRGRTWHMPEGNLATTHLIVGNHDPKRAATLGFVAGLSLSNALSATAPGLSLAVAADAATTQDGSRFALKWPNDVLADGSKLAGILLESTFLPNGQFAIAIGIGVNVVAYPPDLPYSATSLRSLGMDVSAGELFTALSAAWAKNIALWDKGRGLAAIRDRWLARAAGLGGDVAVRLDGEVLRGKFETIDEDCRFVIRMADGSLTQIAAGDVHFGAVASASAS